MLPAFETNFYYAAWMTFAPGKIAAMGTAQPCPLPQSAPRSEGPGPASLNRYLVIVYGGFALEVIAQVTDCLME